MIPCPKCKQGLTVIIIEGELDGYACIWCKVRYEPDLIRTTSLEVEGVEYFDGEATGTTDEDSGDSLH